MKKFAALCLAVAMVLAAAPAMADHLAKLKKTDLSGKVTMVEEASFTITDDSGSEKTLHTEAETKVMGADGAEMTTADIKADAMVKVSAAEADGKWWAAEVWIQ